MLNGIGVQLLTSESVTEGHPDKLADQISDAILDEVLRQDPVGRVAVETLLTGTNVIIAGEITTSAKLDVEHTARETIRNAGYTSAELGFSADTAKMHIFLQRQSGDIALGVGVYGKESLENLGAGDQGIMYGYATDETKELMPLPIVLAHTLVRRLAKVRKKGILPYLRPDGKSQVTMEYHDGRPARAHTVLVSAQHDPEASLARIKKDVMAKVIRPVIPKRFLDRKTKILVNPTGRFVTGGPVGDTGLTGRKIIVDTYGGVGSHGGGAFSGKDPTKVDRSGSYAARWVAKNIVAAGLAKKAEVQIAYAIGVARPLAVNINTYGTGTMPDAKLQKIVLAVFDLRPGMLIKNLRLRRPIYQRAAAYGHFGRTDIDLPWERTDKAAKLRKLAR